MIEITQTFTGVARGVLRAPRAPARAVDDPLKDSCRMSTASAIGNENHESP